MKKKIKKTTNAKDNLYYRYFLLTNVFLRRTGFLVTGKWLYYGLLIGIVTALGAVIFMKFLQLMNYISLQKIVGYTGRELNSIFFSKSYKAWLIALVPTLGALIGGLITHKFAPETKGHGTDHVIKSFHKEGGNIKIRTPIIKVISTVFVLGTGGSAGREGPIAQIGAGFASFLGRILKVNIKERRIMLISGASAGISAIFGAPLGGALFGAEVLYRNHELESEAIIPSVISSIISFSVFKTIMRQESLFVIPQVTFGSWKELIPYTILAILCAAIGIFYVKIFYKITKIFDNLKIYGGIKPAVGGFLVGILSLFLPQILGGGYGYIQMAFYNQIPFQLLILLIFGKIFATSFTIGSGGSGGVFAPSLFIGAMLGGATAEILYKIFPAGWMPVKSAFVVVGMGGFFAGIARVPIASLIMVSEMTKGYELIVPMMLVSSLTFLLNRRAHTLYEAQAKGIMDSPVHKGDFEVDILKDIKVKDVPINKEKVITIPRRMPLRKIIDIITHTSQDTFPVIDTKTNILIGIFTLEDIREELVEKDLLDAVVADDIATQDFPYVTMNDNLHSAMEKFLLKDYDALPILDTKTKKFIGLLTRTNFIKIYNQKLAETKK